MTNKIKPGMYVRTEYGIAKIKEKLIKNVFVLDEAIMIDNMEGYEDHCMPDDVLGEPSYEIIDVIRPGDLITLKGNYCIGEVYQVVIKADGVLTVNVFGDGSMMVYNDNIESIVTKEQFEMMVYKVGEKNES